MGSIKIRDSHSDIRRACHRANDRLASVMIEVMHEERIDHDICSRWELFAKQVDTKQIDALADCVRMLLSNFKRERTAIAESPIDLQSLTTRQLRHCHRTIARTRRNIHHTKRPTLRIHINSKLCNTWPENARTLGPCIQAFQTRKCSMMFARIKRRIVHQFFHANTRKRSCW